MTTKRMSKAMMAAALLAAGCGDEALRGVADEKEAVVLPVPTEIPVDVPVTEVPEVVTPNAGLSVDLRMRSIGAEGFTAIQMFVDDVEARVDGVPLHAQITNDLVDLSNMGHATKVATMVLPEGAQKVDFVVRLAPSGFFQNKHDEGWLDARRTELRFSTSIENLAKNGKAVIEMNAAKSLVAREPGTLKLVPKFRLEY